MRNWRTSLAAIGVLTTIAGKIAAEGFAAVTPETIAAVVAAVGLLFARDEAQHKADVRAGRS